MEYFFRQIVEFGFFGVEVGDQFLGFGFGGHQNVVRQVFRLNGFGLGFVVRGLDLGIGDRMRFDVVFQISLGQLIHAADAQRGGHSRIFVQPLVGGFRDSSSRLISESRTRVSSCGDLG